MSDGSGSTPRRGTYEITIAPTDAPAPSRWKRFLAFLADLWPRSRAPAATVRTLADKAIVAGEATLDRNTLVNEKLAADTEVALLQAREAGVRAQLDEESMLASLDRREAEAAMGWAEAAKTRAEAFRETVEGLKILKELGVTIKQEQTDQLLTLFLKSEKPHSTLADDETSILGPLVPDGSGGWIYGSKPTQVINENPFGAGVKGVLVPPKGSLDTAATVVRRVSTKGTIVAVSVDGRTVRIAPPKRRASQDSGHTQASPGGTVDAGSAKGMTKRSRKPKRR